MDRDARQHWNDRYRTRGPNATEPSPFLLECAPTLPTTGTALDVAGGSGRNALWLARRGLEITLVDIAEEGLALARTAAAEADLSLGTLERDVETRGLPFGSFDVVVCSHYLFRPLFEHWVDVLVPGGLLVFEQPTRSNLERHDHPSERFLLEDDELPGLVRGLHVVSYSEGWTESGRHEARLLARKAVPFLRDEVKDKVALEDEAGSLRRQEDLVALGRRGELMRLLGHLDDARKLLEQAVARSRQRGDLKRLSANRIRLATARYYAGQHEQAELDLRAVISDTRASGEDRLRAYALQHLGKCVAEQGRYEEAAHLFRKALEIREVEGDEALIESSRKALDVAEVLQLED